MKTKEFSLWPEFDEQAGIERDRLETTHLFASTLGLVAVTTRTLPKIRRVAISRLNGMPMDDILRSGQRRSADGHASA